MKKRWMAGIMGIYLLVGTALPVGAAESNSQDMDLKAEVESKFTLTIPQSTDIVFGQKNTILDGNLKVTGNVDTDEQVTVTVTANPLKKKEAEDKIEYRLIKKDGTDNFTSEVWSETELRAGLTGAQGQKEITLSVEITEEEWNKAKAGDYEATVTFLAELEPATNL